MPPKQVTQRNTETGRTFASISFPADLWKRARKIGIDLGMHANQIVAEGLEIRVAQLEKIGADGPKK